MLSLILRIMGLWTVIAIFLQTGPRKVVLILILIMRETMFAENHIENRLEGSNGDSFCSRIIMIILILLFYLFVQFQTQKN